MNRLEGMNVPVVSFFHFHQTENGRTYLVQFPHRSIVCDTPRCSFLIASDIETATADDVLGLKPVIVEELEDASTTKL